ncbi:MAG: helix-hairpin-helix domain-containing protein, partial [Syntrophobacterales bacterium]
MRKKTKRILATIILIIFVAGQGIGTALAQEQVKVNINKASVDELSTLKHIGPSYAQRIVDYREKNGPFQKPEDIMKVRGIGIKTFEANKD